MLINQNSSRLYVVDALRGFAIISIMLIHNLEHFDYYFLPENLSPWMKALDKQVWDVLFFLFAGKSYAIFALLFGLTFFIQSDNQAKKGKDFRGRFAWRLILLLGFGIINSAFYQGDILTIYAIIGFGLIPVAKLKDSWVLIIATLLMLQPYEWINFACALQHPEVTPANPASWAYFGKMGEYIPKDSFIDTVIGNLTNGRPAVFNWSWENGRVFQTLSLFMLGMLAGRKGLFKESDSNIRFWKKALVISLVAFIPLFQAKTNVGTWYTSEALIRPLGVILSSWANLAFMIFLVSSFVLLFRTSLFNKALNLLAPIGRMSLSNYIIQSILGSFIYYGFGLGMYQFTGATHCLIIGICLAILQGIFSTWWLHVHKQGPLESLWHKATWVGRQD